MKKLICNTQTKEKEYIELTQEEIEIRNDISVIEQQKQAKQDILEELNSLDAQINTSRALEDMISGNFPHQSIIDIISRKNELRQQLKEM